MKFFKELWNKILHPNRIFLILFYIFFVISTVGTLLLVILIPNQSVLHYIMYAISAISLTYFIYTMVIFAPKMKSSLIVSLKRNGFTNSLLKDYGYRTTVFSICSSVVNILFIAFLIVMSILGKTAWYATIAAYYIVLVYMKGNVFYSKSKYGTKEKSIKALRFSGIMFILLTIAFSGVIVLIYKANRYFEYAGVLIYAVAAFTFYKLILAIFNIFKAKKHDDLYTENLRNINLASVLLSLVVLQVAMFQTFAPEHNIGFANALTGGAVSLVILVLGVLMIIKANKKLKENKTKETQEKEQQ